MRSDIELNEGRDHPPPHGLAHAPTGDGRLVLECGMSTLGAEGHLAHLQLLEIEVKCDLDKVQSHMKSRLTSTIVVEG